MALFITKINNASSNVVFNYFESEHIWGSKTVATYDFSILDVQYDDGTDALLSGIEALQLAYARPEIAAKIGVDEFKNGNVTSISFPSSERVGSTTASITIEETARVTDDSVLSDIADNIPSPQDVESFSANFSFSRSDNDYSYTRTANLKYKQDTSGDFLNKAYLFLKNIYLGNRPEFGYQTDGISENARFNLKLKPLLQEEIDQIGKSVQLTESFSSSRITVEDGITYSKNSTHSNSLTEDGYTEKIYNLEIKALEEPLETVLNSGIELSLLSLLVENTGYGKPFRIEKTINSDGGQGNLSVSFTDDPRRNQQTNVVYSVSKNGGGDFDEYSINVDVNTRGYNRNTAFIASKDYIDVNKHMGLIKIPAMFDITSGELFEKSRQVSYNPFERSASQSVSYSLDSAYKYEGDGVLKRGIQVSDTKQINRHDIVPIYGDKELAIENSSAKTAGTRSVSVDMVSLNSNRALDALQLASGELPPYNYYYMTAKRSNEQPTENSVNATIDFTFFD